VIDSTNGAAMATLDGLRLLKTQGFQCQAFCSSRLDGAEEVLIEEALARRGVCYEVRNAQIGQQRARIGEVPGTQYRTIDRSWEGGSGDT
jgi:hypothetical protein